MSQMLTNEIRENVAEVYKCETIKNRQRDMMLDESMSPSIDVDPCLAKNIYDILNGKTDEVLTYDVIKRLMDEAKHNMISVGYGVSIDRKLGAYVGKIVSKGGALERIDYISPDEYEAYVVISRKSRRRNSNSTYDYRKIDLKNDEIYNMERVRALQEYFRRYFLEEEKSKTKKIVK